MSNESIHEALTEYLAMSVHHGDIGATEDLAVTLEYIRQLEMLYKESVLLVNKQQSLIESLSVDLARWQDIAEQAAAIGTCYEACKFVEEKLDEDGVKRV